MRHRVAHRKLGRVTSHRIALLRSQAVALLEHEPIETTVPKAKELRPFVERLITIAKRGVKAADPKGKSLSARRLVMRDLLDETVVTEAVRRSGASLQRSARRLYTHPACRSSSRRCGGDRADRAHRQRVRPEEGRGREDRPPSRMAASRSRRRASASV